MAQQEYKVDIGNLSFPLLSEQQTRTIIGQTRGESPSLQDKSGVLYAHNVMPSETGYSSVGFLDAINRSPDMEEDHLVDVQVIYGHKGLRLYIGYTNKGKVYTLHGSNRNWKAVPNPAPSFLTTMLDPANITYGTVNGRTYIFNAVTKGCYYYDQGQRELIPVILTSLDTSEIIGITASNGYLIAVKNDAVAWSSTISPTDFTPLTIVTGKQH